MESNTSLNMPTADDILLDVRNIKQHFPVLGGILRRPVAWVYALDDVSLYVKKGECLGVVGESGCGKTTLGRSILRLYQPTGGSIIFKGRDITRLSDKELMPLRKSMQMIFQDPYASLNVMHSVGEIVQEPLDIHNVGTKAERKERVAYLLERVGLPASAAYRFPHEFSGGQRQRIGIARAIALQPELIICDEPVSALDVSVQSQVLNLLMELQQEMKLSYIFIAHDINVVRHVSDRVAVMYLGKIVEILAGKDIFTSGVHPYTRALISAVPEPNPFIKKTREILQGDVPSPMNPPRGCRFHTRCSHAQDICRESEPKLCSYPGFAEGHMVACHRATELV